LKEPQNDDNVPNLEWGLWQPFACAASTQSPQPNRRRGMENLKEKVSALQLTVFERMIVLDWDMMQGQEGS
jgi:hypothetical protein